MTQTLAISLSESFLQLGLKEGEGEQLPGSDATNQIPLKTRSYFLPKTSIRRSLSDFVKHHKIQSVQRAILHFRSPKFILNKQLGTPPAVFVTAGFEDWLNMNLPVRESQFHSLPSRVPTPLDRDLIFGVSERTDSKGNVQQPIEEQELHFLVSKLKMSNVENVCLCFLHSSKNADNLNFARGLLQSHGFRVFTSTFEGEDEKARWWSSIVEAYLQPFYHESLTEIIETLELSSPDSLHLSSRSGLIPIGEGFHTSSLFGEQSYIEKWCQSRVPAGSQVTFLGLEEFYSFTNTEPSLSNWNSPFGAIALEIPRLYWHQQQPTGIFEKSFWGVPEIGREQAGFEPGPMCLGRGIRPTLLDLIFLSGELKSAPVLSEYLSKRAIPRVKESLISLFDDKNKDYTEQEILQNCLDLVLHRMTMELLPDHQHFFVGPLADFFARRIQKFIPSQQVEVLNTEMSLPLWSLVEVSEKESSS